MSDLRDLLTLAVVVGIGYYVYVNKDSIAGLFQGSGLAAPNRRGNTSSDNVNGGSYINYTSGTVLWDSNTRGKWNNGKKRTVDSSEGSQSPNGKGLFTAASGNPELVIDGNGVAHLRAGSGRGRIYVKATNYNSVLEGEFMFESKNVDNLSIKVRSRRGEGGSCENRFGGVGTRFERNGGGFKIEKCHNEHESGVNFSNPANIKDGTWYKFKFLVQDKGGGIYQQSWINGKSVGSTTFKNPPSYYTNKQSFMKESYFWLRSNNSGDGSIAFRNVRMTQI